MFRTIAHPTFDRFGFLSEERHESVVNIILDKDACARNTCLTGSYECGKCYSIDGGDEICIIENYNRCLWHKIVRERRKTERAIWDAPCHPTQL